jgi:2-oxoglutarate ferredoxin oxidoreductase subunit delta
MPERIRHPPLDAKSVKHPKGEVHLIKDQCKGCSYCIQFCPKKVLEESQEINARGVRPPKVADESKCVACNFCMVVCPDFAIYVTEKPCQEGC